MRIEEFINAKTYINEMMIFICKYYLRQFNDYIS